MTFDNDNYGFRFREWDIYRDSRTVRREINELLKTFPKEEKYALVDQTKRALNSIVLNIAESANKNTDKDMRVYINRAHCSLDEILLRQSLLRKGLCRRDIFRELFIINIDLWRLDIKLFFRMKRILLPSPR